MYKKRDVVLVKFHPSFGLELKKYRPALVLFDSVDPRFITILPLSTKTRINTSKHDVELSGEFLNTKSWVLAWHPTTIDSSRIMSKLGEITRLDYKKISKILVNLIK